MKKIIIVTPQFDKNIGGMERFIIEFSKEASAIGKKITVLTSKSKYPLEVEGIKIIRFNLFVPRILNKVIKYLHLSLLAKKHLEKNNYDCVIAMGFSGFFLRSHVWRASGPPVEIIKKHTYKYRQNIFGKFISLDFMLQKKIEKKCFENASFHVFPSEYMKSLFEKEYGKINTPYFIPCSGIAENRQKKQDKKKKITVLTVGGLSEARKGRETIINAFSGLEDGISLLVAGEVKKKPELKSAVYLGRVPYEKMQEIYNNSDIFIAPSYYEGFPNAVLEASSFGLPVIASRLEGIEEYFEEGKEIVLTEKGDSEMLKKSILDLAKDEKRREMLSKNIYRRLKNIRYKIFAKELIRCIEEKKSINLLERIKKG